MKVIECYYYNSNFKKKIAKFVKVGKSFKDMTTAIYKRLIEETNTLSEEVYEKLNFEGKGTWMIRGY